MKGKVKRVKDNGPDYFCALVRSDLKIDIVREHKFLPDRRFRFDYAIPEYKIAIEKEGGIWMKGGGAHSRPTAILRDMEKYTLAATTGWIVIRRTPKQICTIETLNLIRQAIQLIENQQNQQ